MLTITAPDAIQKEYSYPADIEPLVQKAKLECELRLKEYLDLDLDKNWWTKEVQDWIKAMRGPGSELRKYSWRDY